ncbi:MAG: hypothetical protein IPG45_12160 [Deltaproteobacteria bacterium]|jgi:diacylglycerol kinase family enzyme|nr:hypothetical protein [Deltaproteobacteria bacterium]
MLPSPSRLRPLDETLESPRGRAELRLVRETPRAAVLLNAHAKRVGPSVRDALLRVVPAEDLYYCRSIEEGQAAARSIIDRRYHSLLVGGGDGTITTTINLLHQAAEARGRRTALPDLGLLKLGTGNGLANLTGSGKPIEDVARLMGGDRPNARPLRLIEDPNTGWVFPFASMGYDAQVLNDYVDLVRSTKSKVGQVCAKTLAGYFYAIGTRTIPTELKAQRAKVRVIATGRASILDPENGEEIPLEQGATLFEGHARGVAMGTSPFYGYGLKALPHALRRTDRFHVRVSTASITYLLTHLPGLWRGDLKTPDFVDFLVESVRVESTEPLPVQMAGDAKGHARTMEMRLSDRAIRLLDGTGLALS